MAIKKTTRQTAPLGDDFHISQLFGNGQVQNKPIGIYNPPSYIIDPVPVDRIGHCFGPCDPCTSPDQPMQYLVQDFIMDQTGLSGCLGKMTNIKKFDLTKHTGYLLNIYSRDPHKKFTVNPPPGAGTVFFSLDSARLFNSFEADTFDYFTALSAFRNLSGPPPSVTNRTFYLLGSNTN